MNRYDFYLTAGNTYIFSLCSDDGGSVSYDSYLGLYTGGFGDYQSSYSSSTLTNDDDCGTASRITYTPTSTGWTSLYISGWSSNYGSYTLAYKYEGGGGGGGSAVDCDNEVAIGNGTTTYYYYPVNMYFNYSLTQQLYTPDEIGTAGTINAISFYYDYSSSFSMSGVQLYMKNVGRSSFSSNTDMEPISASDLVWSGTFSASGSGWKTINLTTPFEYDGSSNLLVCMYDPTSGYPGSSYKFRTHTTTYYSGIHWYSDSYCPQLSTTSFSGSKSYTQYRNNIKLCITPGAGSACDMPSSLTMTSVQARTAVASWSGGSGTYDVEYKASTASSWTQLLTNTTTTSRSIQGLNPGTSYQVRVRSLCNGATSSWRTTTFTTSQCPTVAVIGDGGSNTSSYIPSYSFFNYTLSQQIYTPCEIGGGGYINSISFYNNGTAYTRTYDIYLKHTNKMNFSSSSDWIPVTTADKVFTGTVSLTSGTWTTLYFNTPFAYDGVNNLVVVVDDNTGSYESSMSCRTYTADGNQTLYIYSDGTNYSATSPSYSGTLMSSKNQLHFGICDQQTISGSYTVSTSVSPGSSAGSVTGAGTYAACATVTLTATPTDCYRFVNWTENGTVVSTSPTYSFKASANRTLVANFQAWTLTLSSSPSTTTCLDYESSVTFTASTNAPTTPTYHWSNGATSSSLTITQTEASTNYVVSATVGSCTKTKNKTVTIVPEITELTSSVDGLLCIGGSATLTAVTPVNGATFAWSNGDSGSPITVTPSATTTYNVTASTANCSATGSITVEMVTTLDPGAIADVTICSEDHGYTLTSVSAAVACGIIEYEWHIGSIVTPRSTSPDYTLTASDITTLGLGDHTMYRVFYDQNGNTQQTASVILTVNAAMAQPSVAGNRSVICGYSTNLSATAENVGEHARYLWYSDPEGQNLVYEGAEFHTPALTENTTYYLQVRDEYLAESSTVFSYTGGAQTYNIPVNTEQLKLEVWGAQGGGNQVDGNTNGGVGGKGGYSVGTLENLAGVNSLSVYVGGQGQTSNSQSAPAPGGWNGGGTAFASTDTDPACGGGGATDIRINGTTLYDRIIVAGGGGGGGEDSEQGGAGGGATGVTGSGSSYTGGTQTAGGSGAVFGIGASTQYDGGAGGGGWYGGGCGGGTQTIPTTNSTSDSQGGCGGSGYVWTAATASNAPTGYNVPVSYYLADAQTIAGNATMPNPNSGTMTGREGNGFARITAYQYVRNNCPSVMLPVEVTVTQMAAPEVAVRSACIGEPSELVVTNPVEGFQYQWSTTPEFGENDIVYTGITYTPTVNDATTYYVRSVATSSQAIDFEYTGSEQIYTVPAGVSQIQLEVWGAQGGEGNDYSSTGNPRNGGAGGYSVGTIHVNSGDVLYVYVGQQGLHNAGSESAWNGGGAQGVAQYEAGTGGGATDIRIGQNSLYSRVIVAGGGGGGGNGSIGGAGGGVSGIQPATSTQFSSRVAGIGGGATSGYQFGVGQGLNGENLCGGGGGGWYGGASGANSTGGGGGSGYVYTSATASNYPSGCLLNSSYYLTDAQTIAGTESFLGPNGEVETGHSGNGFARITVLGMVGDVCPSEVATVTLTPVQAPNVNLTASDLSSCNQTAIILTAATSSNDITSYEWSDGTVTQSNTHEVTPGITTTYTVIVSNGTCAVESQPVTISVDAPEVTLSGSDNGNCVEAGEEVTLTANMSGGLAQNAAEYQFSVSNRTFSPISSSSTSVTTGDDAYTTVPIGFTFNYCGVDYTQARVATNGYIQLGATSGGTLGNDLTSTSINPVIAAYWDDIDGDVMYVQTLGSAPNRVFVFHTQGDRLGNSAYTYQIRLYETTNKIEIHYGSAFNMSSASASIGLNSNNGGLSFLSVTPTGSGTATTSTSTANNSIGTAVAAYLTAGTVYTFTPGTPASYQWAANGVNIPQATERTLTVSPEETSTYTLTVNDGDHGCPAVLDYTVRVKSNMEITADPATLCSADETSVLTATGAESYVWGDGTQGNVLNVQGVGNYSVSGVDAYGCSVNADYTLLKPDFAAGSIVTDQVTTCQSSNEAVVIASAEDGLSGGGITYRWLRDGNPLDNSNVASYSVEPYELHQLAAGSYTYTRQLWDACNDEPTWVNAEGSFTLTVTSAFDNHTYPVTGAETPIVCGTGGKLCVRHDPEVINFWYTDSLCTNLYATGDTVAFSGLFESMTLWHVAQPATAVYGLQEVSHQDFSYTGGAQTYNIPANAEYLKLEVWGAEGGGRRVSGLSDNGLGGLGGYSVGTMPVLGNESIQVYVGGIGGYSSTSLAYGGYNGGGTTYGSSDGEPAGGGGGGTDIRLNGNTLYHRIIVAGGGGGGGEDASDQGGYGGGTSGGPGNSYSYQGTQTSSGTGGVFGSGASSPNDGGAGGGGWYGGGTNGGSQTIPTTNSGSDCSGGSGGSGYVWTSATASSVPSGYSVPASYYLTNAQTIAGNTAFPAPAGGTETGHQGNGFARITACEYVIIGYEPLGCPSIPQAYTLQVTEQPMPDVENATVACGVPVTLSVGDNYDPQLEYVWSTSSDFNENSIIGTGREITVTNEEGNYTYYVRSYKSFHQDAAQYTQPVQFEYTGDVQSISVPQNATSALLEVWGAQGGNLTNSGYNWYGGHGGYAAGTLNVTPGDVLNVYVGGQGINGQTNTSGSALGGWNGGGNSGTSSGSNTSYFYGASGGGSSDIRINSTSLYARVLVAGGGGGAGYGQQTTNTIAGGHGGGTQGSDGICATSGRSGYAGTATSAGAGGVNGSLIAGVQGQFGMGAASSASSSYSSGGGGGGGWYGGGSGSEGNGWAGSGGGGSGYVYTSSTASNYPSGCQLNSSYYLTSAQTIAGNATMPNPNGGTMTGREGNGYARITFTINQPAIDNYCESEVKEVTLTVNPAAQVAVQSVSVPCGEPVTLSVDNPVDGIFYNWYADQACTRLVHQGTTWELPAQGEDVTYYVRSYGLRTTDATVPDEVVVPFSGETFEFTVPRDVEQVTLQVWGAQGGNVNYGSNQTQYGGKGGYATGTLAVESGEVLYVNVGGRGEDGTSAAINPDMLNTRINGGFNGGGAGGSTGLATANYYPGAGGGGASDVRVGGNTLNDRVLVAGGGGGAAHHDSNGQITGGYGGGLNGGAGQSSVTTRCGGGATGTTGGTAASGATAGQQGQGGNGATGGQSGSGGAGGGGGYYGGGGGAAGNNQSGAAGGGSGYVGGVNAGNTIAGNDPDMPNPDGGTMTGREGDGIAIISFNRPVYDTLCMTNPAEVSITIIPLVTPSIPDKNILCGSSTTLSITEPDNSYTYIWYSDANCTQRVRTGQWFELDGYSNTAEDTVYYVKAYYNEIAEDQFLCQSERTEVHITTFPIGGPESAYAANMEDEPVDAYCTGSDLLFVANTAISPYDDEREEPMVLWFNEEDEFLGVTASGEALHVTSDQYGEMDAYVVKAYAATDLISMSGSFALSTTEPEPNGCDYYGKGVFVDVTANADMTVDSISFYPVYTNQAANTSDVTTTVYYRPGSCDGFTSNVEEWEVAYSGNLSQTAGVLCKIPFTASINVSAGERYSFYVVNEYGLYYRPYNNQCNNTVGIHFGDALNEYSTNAMKIYAGYGTPESVEPFATTHVNYHFLGNISYSLMGETQFGCVSERYEEAVAAIEQPASVENAVINVADTFICAGTAVTLTLNGGTQGTSGNYVWTSGDCDGQVIAQGFESTYESITVQPEVTTTYYFKFDSEICGATECLSKTIYVEYPTLIDEIEGTVLCARSPLDIPTPAFRSQLANVEVDVVNKGWQCSEDGENFQWFTDSTAVSESYNGWWVRYCVVTHCADGTGYSNAVRITVDSLPAVAALTQPAPLCSQSTFDWDESTPEVVFHNNSESDTEKGWKLMVDQEEIDFDPEAGFDYGQNVNIWYYATNACGTTETEPVTLQFMKKPEVERLDGLDGAVCAGLPFAIEAPETHTFGGTVEQGWEYVLTYGSTLYTRFPADTIIDYGMNHTYVSYYIGNECGISHSRSVELLVNDVPVLGELSAANGIYCSDDEFDLEVPEVISDGSLSPLGTGWYLSRDSALYSDNILTAVDVTNGIDADTWNEQWLRYADTNACGVTFSNAVQIAVHPALHLVMTAPQGESLCYGPDYTLNASSDVQGVSFAWTGEGLSAQTGNEVTVNAPRPGDWTYMVTAVDNETGCEATADVALHFGRIYKNVTLNICASELNYVFDPVMYPDSVCTQSGFYTYEYETEDGCDSVVNLTLNVTYPIERTTRVHYCNYPATSYVWPVTGESFGNETMSDTVIRDTVIIPCTSSVSDLTGEHCDSITYYLEFTISNEPYLEIPVTDVVMPVNQPASAEFNLRKECEYVGAQMAISYNFYKNDTLIDIMSNYGNVSISTYMPEVNHQFGDVVRAGTGEVPGNTFSLYNYDYNYFYADYFATLTNTVTASWNQPGEYKLELVVTGMERGMDYAYTDDNGQVMGGAGARPNGRVYADTMYIKFHVGTVDTMPAIDTVVCSDDLPIDVYGTRIDEAGHYEISVGSEGEFVMYPVNVTVNTVSFDEFTVTLNGSCNSYTWNGVTYTSAGDYRDTLRYASGCDSLITTLHLRMGDDVVIDTNVMACGSFEWLVNGEVYTESGDYTAVGTFGNCPATYNLHLTVNNAYDTTIYVMVAPMQMPYAYDADHVYDAEGVYDIVYQCANGCDSTLHIDLAVATTGFAFDTIVEAPNMGETAEYNVNILSGGLDNMKVAIDYEITRNGEIINNISDYGYVYFSTDYADIHQTPGRQLYTGVGSIPANSFRVIHYQYTYFYLNFLDYTTNHLTARWNLPGEYEIKFFLRERDGGEDYVLTFDQDDPKLVGGGGSTRIGGDLAVASLVMHYNIDTVFMTLDTVTCSNELPFVYHGHEFTASTDEPQTIEFSDPYLVSDTVVTFSLTVNQAYELFDTAYICAGGEYQDQNFTLSADTIARMTRWNNGEGKAVFTLNGQTEKGCDSTVTLTLYVLPLPTIAIYAPTTSVCEGISIELDASGNADRYVWTGEQLVLNTDNTNNNNQNVEPVVNDNQAMTEVEGTTLPLTVNANVTVYLTGYIDSLIYPEQTLTCSVTDSIALTAVSTGGLTEYYASVCQGLPYADEIFNVTGAQTAEDGEFYVDVETGRTTCGIDTARLHVTVYPVYNARFGYAQIEDNVCEGYGYDGGNNGFALSAEVIDSLRHVNPTHVANAVVLYDTTETVMGCDSITQLTLHILPTTYGNKTVHFCVNSLPMIYTENEQEFEVTGDTTVNVLYQQTVNGCDSICRVSIVFDPMPTVELLGTDVCANAEMATLSLEISGNVDSIRWTVDEEPLSSDDVLTIDASQFESTISYNVYAGACVATEEFNINLIENPMVTIDTAVCEGTTYVAPDGTEFTTAQEAYEWYSAAPQGCDILYVLNLSINPTYNVSVSETIDVTELPYVWNGLIVEAAGSHTAHLTASTGCDSLVTLVLTVTDTHEGAPFMLAEETGENEYSLIAYANSVDPNTKVAIAYSLYKDGELVNNIDADCGGELYMGTQLLNAYMGEVVYAPEGTIPGNTFRFSVNYLDYYYFHFLNGRENKITHSFTEPGEYEIVFKLTTRNNGQDQSLTYTFNGQSRNIGGSFSSEGDSLAGLTISFTVDAVEEEEGDGTLPALLVDGDNETDVQTATSTVTMTCEGNGYEPNTQLAINYVILRDEQPLSTVSNVANINISTYFPAFNTYVGGRLEQGSGNMIENTFTLMNMFHYNYFYLHFMEATNSQIVATWNQPGEYQMVFTMVEMKNGSDVSIAYDGSHNAGGQFAESKNTTLATATINYSVPASPNGAPMGIDDNDQSQLGLYPNPARDIVHVQCMVDDAQLTVTDMSGKVVYAVNGTHTGTIDLNVNGWSAGVYFVNLRDNDKVITKKLVVTK